MQVRISQLTAQFSAIDLINLCNEYRVNDLLFVTEYLDSSGDSGLEEVNERTGLLNYLAVFCQKLVKTKYWREVFL